MEYYLYSAQHKYNSVCSQTLQITSWPLWSKLKNISQWMTAGSSKLLKREVDKASN